MAKRGSTKKQERVDEGWLCKLCEIMFTDDKAELLEC